MNFIDCTILKIIKMIDIKIYFSENNLNIYSKL